MILLIIGVPVAAYLLVCTIVGILAVHKNDKEGYKIEKRTRYRRKTYDDGFGKYTVNIKDEELVRVPKDQNK